VGRSTSSTRQSYFDNNSNHNGHSHGATNSIIDNNVDSDAQYQQQQLDQQHVELGHLRAAFAEMCAFDVTSTSTTMTTVIHAQQQQQHSTSTSTTTASTASSSLSNNAKSHRSSKDGSSLQFEQFLNFMRRGLVCRTNNLIGNKNKSYCVFIVLMHI
jgi:hypothetical protein